MIIGIGHNLLMAFTRGALYTGKLFSFMNTDNGQCLLHFEMQRFGRRMVVIPVYHKIKPFTFKVSMYNV